MSNYARPTRTAEEIYKRNEVGGRWIRPEARLAIMLRDGMQCVYCGSCVEGGAHLSLDHITPWSLCGNNKSSNLITCCLSCNSRRRDTHLSQFTTPQVIKFINNQRRLSLASFRVQAKALLASRNITSFTRG